MKIMNWNKITESLPEKNDKYLSWDGRDVQFAYFKDGYFLMCLGPVIRYFEDEIPFTHWMPLPMPPLLEENND